MNNCILLQLGINTCKKLRSLRWNSSKKRSPLSYCLACYFNSSINSSMTLCNYSNLLRPSFCYDTLDSSYSAYVSTKALLELRACYSFSNCYCLYCWIILVLFIVININWIKDLSTVKWSPCLARKLSWSLGFPNFFSSLKKYFKLLPFINPGYVAVF